MHNKVSKRGGWLQIFSKGSEFVVQKLCFPFQTKSFYGISPLFCLSQEFGLSCREMSVVFNVEWL